MFAVIEETGTGERQTIALRERAAGTWSTPADEGYGPERFRVIATTPDAPRDDQAWNEATGAWETNAEQAAEREAATEAGSPTRLREFIRRVRERFEQLATRVDNVTDAQQKKNDAFATQLAALKARVEALERK